MCHGDYDLFGGDSVGHRPGYIVYANAVICLKSWVSKSVRSESRDPREEGECVRFFAHASEGDGASNRYIGSAVTVNYREGLVKTL